VEDSSSNINLYFYPMEQFGIDILIPSQLTASGMGSTGGDTFHLLLYNYDVNLLSLYFSYLFPLLFILVGGYIGRSTGYLVLEKINGFLRVLIPNYFTHLLEFVSLIIALVFSVVLVWNVLGLIPGSFCFTSQILVTFTLSSLIFFGAFSLSAVYGRLEFLAHFVPKNVPTALKPFLAVIEVISYISRLFSLAIRLFANLVAGHSLLHILSESNVKIGTALGKIDFYLVIFILVVSTLTGAILFLEIGIGFLQAYVFAVLGLIYFREVEHYLEH